MIKVKVIGDRRLVPLLEELLIWSRRGLRRKTVGNHIPGVLGT